MWKTIMITALMLTGLLFCHSTSAHSTYDLTYPFWGDPSDYFLASSYMDDRRSCEIDPAAWFHTGADFYAPVGTSFRACENGDVIQYEDRFQDPSENHILVARGGAVRHASTTSAAAPAASSMLIHRDTDIRLNQVICLFA